MEKAEQIDITVGHLKRKVARSALSVTGGNIVIQIISSAGGILLARLLIPSMFGVFAIVNFVVTFLTIFGEMGLGAALIQRKEQLTREDLKTVFTMQQILSCTVIALIFLISPKIVSWYALDDTIRWLLIVLSFSIFLSSLRGVPSALLQREMKFDRVVICETANVFFFQSVAIFLAYLGYGTWGFIWGVLAGSLVSTILFYILSPWKIGYGINRQIALRLIKFGIPYQADGLLTLGKNAVVPVVVGKIVGASGIGYFNWALNFSALAMFFTGVIGRVTFPAFSRVQHDKDLLRKGIEKSIRIGAIFFFPFLAMSVAFARPTIHYLYTDKWLPALGTFYLLAISTVFTGPIGQTFFNAFYATGKQYWALNMNILYLALNFALAVPLVSASGLQGMAVTKIIISFSTLFILIYLLNRIVKVNLLGNILPFMFPSFFIGAIFYLYREVLAGSFPGFLFWGVSGGILCFVSMYLFNAASMKEDIKDVVNALSRDGK